MRQDRKNTDSVKELEDIPNRRQDPLNTVVVHDPEVPRESILKSVDFWILVGFIFVVILISWMARKKSKTKNEA